MGLGVLESETVSCLDSQVESLYSLGSERLSSLTQRGMRLLESWRCVFRVLGTCTTAAMVRHFWNRRKVTRGLIFLYALSNEICHRAGALGVQQRLHTEPHTWLC